MTLGYLSIFAQHVAKFDIHITYIVRFNPNEFNVKNPNVFQSIA